MSLPVNKLCMEKPIGFFITLEGPDGSGKSTHAKFLTHSLKILGYPIHHTREPGGTQLAERLRGILLHAKSRMVPVAELFLYLAARAQHVAEVLRPQLARGAVVICERFSDATLAYQGYGRGLKFAKIRQLNALATGGLRPDLTILLDVPTPRGLSRARNAKQRRKRHLDRLERETNAFHRRVRRGYLALATQEPGRIHVVRATGSIRATQARIRALVLEALQRRRGGGHEGGGSGGTLALPARSTVASQ